MPFPKHHIVPDNDTAKKNLQGKEIKKLDFAPMFFCEFFEGMEVLQMQSNETKEYLFGQYWCGKLVGHCYFGDLYTPAEVSKAVDFYMPPTLDDIFEYIKRFGDKMWYYKFDQKQYAWIYQNVITKIND